MLARIIKCDIADCGKPLIEQPPGTGFPGWGVLQGRKKEKGKIAMDKPEMQIHLCPVHFAAVLKLMDKKKITGG